MDDENIPVGGAEDAPPQEKTGERADPSGESPGSSLAQIKRELEETGKSAQAFRDQFLRKAAELENYKQMLEHDPLVFGIGIDNLPRQIYHWIGQDEQALSKEEIAKQIAGLEGFANGK